MTTEIAQNRNIPVETLVALIDQAPFANTQAKDKQLVDHLLYEDEVEDFLDEEFGILHFMEENYGYSRPDGWESDPEIAIIPITGVIMPACLTIPGLLGGGFSAGSKTIVGQINEIADDDAVKAIILRVDSPRWKCLCLRSNPESRHASQIGKTGCGQHGWCCRIWRILRLSCCGCHLR